MYTIVLTLHNLTRWLVLFIGVWALFRRTSGFLRSSIWTATDRASVRWFALIPSLQFVFGAVLYVLPGAFVQSVIGNVSMADIMQARILRFFTLEHPTFALFHA